VLARLFRRYERHLVAGDTVLAVAVLAASIGWTIWVRSTGLSAAVRDRPLVQIAFAFLLVLSVPWRRVRPVLFALCVVVVCVLQIALTGQFVVADVVALIALYTVVAYGPGGWIGPIGLVLGISGGVAASLRWTRPFSAQQAGLGAGFLFVSFVLAAALGERQRNRAAQLAALHERNRLLEIERDQQAAAERARIARELHDVVAHSLSVIVVQADGGAALAATDPPAAGPVLRTISDTGREALGQMRRLLGVLRGPADTAPQPGAWQLPELIEQVRGAGLPVHLHITGDRRALPGDADVTVYRVVQEALTNVLKHAGPVDSVEVQVNYAEGAVMIDVSDDGRGAAMTSDGQGNGLRGMTERVELLGGTLQYGPAGKGFAVHAVLPSDVDSA
jgi:signal transduction histidine kinase